MMDDIYLDFICYDEATQTYTHVYGFIAIDGTPRTVEVPRAKCDPGPLRSHLLTAGARIPPMTDQIHDRLTRITAAEAPIRLRPARNGWQKTEEGEPRSFVSFGFVTSQSSKPILMPPRFNSSGAEADMSVCGTLNEWQQLVAFAGGSTALTIMMCTPFAAPLLALLNRPSFGLVVYGPSRSGKSTGQLMAASAIGVGAEEHLPGLRATESGLLEAGAIYNDHVLLLNEIGTARGTKAEISKVVRGMTYVLMQGQDIRRHSSWSGDSGHAGSFKLIAVLSSEFSPDEWAARGGDARDPGETARLIGFPMIMPRADTIFDWHRTPPAREWIDGKLSLVREGLPNHRGVAFRDFMNRLARQIESATTFTKGVVRNFERRMVRDGMSLIERDVVTNFGVAAAAGVLAARWCILPFDPNFAWRACCRGCLAALASLPDRDANLRNDIRSVRALISGPTIIDVDRCSERQRRLLAHADGFRTKSDRGDSDLFTVRATILADLIGERQRLISCLEWHDDEGLLLHRRARTAGRGIEWAETQACWPDGTRPRSIVFALPRGFAEYDRILND